MAALKRAEDFESEELWHRAHTDCLVHDVSYVDDGHAGTDAIGKQLSFEDIPNT